MYYCECTLLGLLTRKSPTKCTNSHFSSPRANCHLRYYREHLCCLNSPHILIHWQYVYNLNCIETLDVSPYTCRGWHVIQIKRRFYFLLSVSKWLHYMKVNAFERIESCGHKNMPLCIQDMSTKEKKITLKKSYYSDEKPASIKHSKWDTIKIKCAWHFSSFPSSQTKSITTKLTKQKLPAIL